MPHSRTVVLNWLFSIGRVMCSYGASLKNVELANSYVLRLFFACLEFRSRIFFHIRQRGCGLHFGGGQSTEGTS